MSEYRISFNNFSEEVKTYPFHVGFNCGIIIDQKLFRNEEGEVDFGDTCVITSGLPIDTLPELIEVLQTIIDDLKEAVPEDDLTEEKE